MRLIDADAIIAVMDKCAETPEDAVAKLCYSYTSRILKDAPTIDAVPVRHGEWEVISVAETGFSKRVRCTYCKKERIYATNFDNFCPNCGAQMGEWKEE